MVALHTNRTAGQAYATRSEVIAQNGMAATNHPLATLTAIETLKQDGNAIDAAIAANAMMGLIEPSDNGIGGDLFALIWSADDGRLFGLNGSGRSPASLEIDHFHKSGIERIPSTGPLSVSVPGCVDGWFEMLERFGSMEMAVILSPAIGYARQGFPVTEIIAADWQRSAEEVADMAGFSTTFMPGGSTPQKGEIFVNDALAQSYEIIAEQGRNAFYQGEIAGRIHAFMQRAGGFLSSDDLAAHRSAWVEPVSSNYRGYDVWELPPNGQGIAALQILNILEGFDIAAMGFGSGETLHHIIEAKKLAYEDRARFYADPEFSDVPVDALISKEYAETRRRLIDGARAAKRIDCGNPALNKGDTVYLTVADRWGNMVSLIQSNYRKWGSGLCPEGLGFALQNRGELFDLSPGRPNTYAPGKRPFHTIIPAFITRDSRPLVSFGVMGGAMQPQAHAQIVMNLVDFGMNLQEAGDAPRVRHDGSSEPTGERMTDGGAVFLETGFEPNAAAVLQSKGHVLGEGLGGFGGYQAIRFDENNKVYYGASESRKDGHAGGY